MQHDSAPWHSVPAKLWVMGIVHGEEGCFSEGHVAQTCLAAPCAS